MFIGATALTGQAGSGKGCWGGGGWPGPSPDQVHMLFFWNHCGEDSSIQDSYNCPQGYHFWCDDTSRLGGAGREMGIEGESEGGEKRVSEGVGRRIE